MLLTIRRDRSWLDRAILKATWKRDILPADVTASLRLWWAWLWRPAGDVMAKAKPRKRK